MSAVVVLSLLPSVAMPQPFEHVSFDSPHEVREGDNWRLELVNLAGDAQIGRITVQPAGVGPSTSSPPLEQSSVRRRISSIRFPDASTWSSSTAPRQSPGPATSRLYRLARRPGGRRRAGRGDRRQALPCGTIVAVACRSHPHSGRSVQSSFGSSSAYQLLDAVAATVAAAAVAVISSSMSFFTSGAIGACAVASLILDLAWRRPERSGATRSSRRHGPARASSTASRGSSGSSAAAAARTSFSTRS